MERPEFVTPEAWEMLKDVKEEDVLDVDWERVFKECPSDESLPCEENGSIDALLGQRLDPRPAFRAVQHALADLKEKQSDPMSAFEVIEFLMNERRKNNG